jgi:hypothetical protein
VFANLLRRMFNLPMQLVLGYQGGAETTLALLRKEVDGRCGWSLSTLMSVNRELYLTKQVKLVLMLSDKRVSEFADVPTAMEVAENDDQRAILKLSIARQDLARPYVAPPGLPPERLKALRAAFDATMTDPEFLADAKRMNLDVRPTSGGEADILARIVVPSVALVAAGSVALVFARTYPWREPPAEARTVADAQPKLTPISRAQAPDATTVVTRGDSLWRISRATYGTGEQYTAIFVANHAQIRNPNRIYPGQVFALPERTH